MRITTVVLASLAAFSLAAHASAQTFGRRGNFSFAADRLMGLYLFDADGQNTEFIMGLGGPPRAGMGEFNSPRLGLDGFVTNGLSIGGSLWIWHHGNADWTGFLVAPRVGYAIPIGRHFGFWPRGGLTLWDGNHRDDDGVALTGEALFWGSPDKWGFLFGPTLDFQLNHAHAHSLGLLAAGVFGWL